MAKSPRSTITLGTTPLSIAEVVSASRHDAKVVISPTARRAMAASRKVVEDALTDGEPHYGINTGFGSLSKRRINNEDLATLQTNLIRSHHAGVGAPLSREIVRSTMLLLAASLSRGLSGVRPIVAQAIVDLLNADITPAVPEVGSVGASGDLAPLAAIANVLIGEGHVLVNGRAIPTGPVLKRARIKPLALAAKEGLALINGTHLMAGRGALIAHDIEQLITASLLSTAMSIDCCRASDAFLDERLYEARCHTGPAMVASELRRMLSGSTIRTSHLEDDPRVQDPYSLRAAPTVLGAAHWSLLGAIDELEIELGAVTDNPLVFTDRNLPPIVSGANFHGMPIAIPLDTLSIGLTHIAGIAERRIYLITGAFEPESHLKPYLAAKPGLESGLMIAQYTAAACINELVTLAAPASVANVPTSAGMEDYNSFGPRAAAKAARAVELVRHVLAIEFLCAAQGLEYHRPLKSGKPVEKAYSIIRSRVKRLTADRNLNRDIQAISDLIASGAFEGL
ncbi:MAG: histidine ammonia-lyase [Planctomycetes bacterium]|nr:histidine ammonia-lyase [Planctomycetota bacterium]